MGQRPAGCEQQRSRRWEPQPGQCLRSRRRGQGCCQAARPDRLTNTFTNSNRDIRPCFCILWGIFCGMGAADMTQQSGRIWVMGGRPLNGTAAIPAAKNSVLPLLAAALLCRGPVRLRAVPRLSDVECSLGLLRARGAPPTGRGQHCGGRDALKQHPSGRNRSTNAGLHPLLRAAAGAAGPG